VEGVRLSLRPILFVALWGLVGCLPLAGAADALPSADEVMHKAIQRAKWVEEQNFEATRGYTRLSVTDQLDDKGAVKEHEELLYHVHPVEGLPYAELLQKDGKAPTAQDLKKEQVRQKALRERLAQRRRQKDGEEVSLDEEVVGKYRFEVLRREAVNGRAAFVLSFEPRSDDLPVRRKVDRFLNELVGTLWVDEHDYDIPKLVFHLKDDVTFGWGILAAFRKFDVSFEQTRTSNGVWFPSRIDAYVDGRVLFKSFRLRQQEQMSDFRTATAETGEGTPVRE
jgi:hypothetical protein